jgi:hypothetical protein
MKRVALIVVLVLSLVAVHAATPADAAAQAAGCCWCPSYTIYCQRDIQCDTYCGTPGWGACEGGCCACLG